MPNVYGTILFADIVGSTKLWNKYPTKMLPAIRKHLKYLKKIAKEYDGQVVKTIGDSTMVYFPGRIQSLYKAIGFARRLQKYVVKVTANRAIEFRIGMAYGKMQRETLRIQDCDQFDYYGPIVNIASRMESHVAKPGGIAFHNSFNSDTISDTFLKNLPNLQKVFVSSNCADVYLTNYRSSRMLKPACYNTGEIKGIGKLEAYRFSEK